MRLLTLSLCIAACSTTVARVTVPKDPSQDAPPKISVTAVPLVPDGPGAVGDVEPNKATVSTTTSVQVTRGAKIMVLANAVNPGGVQTFSLTVAQGGATLFTASATGTEDAAGTALNTLNLRAPDGNPNAPLTAVVTEPVTVTATAANFNKQTSTITVTYVPADLTVTLTATPSTIGYQSAPSSTLAWSVLYGAPPIKITSNIAPSATIQPTDTLVVRPGTTTTYNLIATDQKVTRSASATVSVRQPPPPPSVSITRSPNDGYNCLGVEDTVRWTTSNCGNDCDVHLTAHGYGYAASYKLDLPHVAHASSFKVTPGDSIDFTVTATSPFGTGSDTQRLTIAPPNVCGGSTAPNLSVFYFAVKASSPQQVQCTWIAAPSDTEANAQAQVQATYGSGYTVTAITLDDYDQHRGCP